MAHVHVTTASLDAYGGDLVGQGYGCEVFLVRAARLRAARLVPVPGAPWM